MTFLKSIALAFSTFSIIPMPRVDWNEKNMRYMMAAFPLVGVFIGILYEFWFIFGIKILYIWQKPISFQILAFGFLLIPILVTGGIHIDGFLDTSDAILSHASREKKFEILKDSHVGAFAVLSCVIYFFAYFVFSCEFYKIFYSNDFFGFSENNVNFFQKFVDSSYVALIPVLSRLLSAFAVAAFPIAKSSGLVYTFANASSKKFTAIWCASCFFLIFALFVFFKDLSGIIVIVSSFFVFIAYFFIAKRNFGGITGDTAGAFLQVCEIFALAGFVIFKEIF